MNQRLETANYFPWLGGFFVIAGIVHIASVLILPRFAPADAFARIAAAAPAGQLTILPRAEPHKELVPFNDPAMADAVCRYDLASGPFRISVNLTSDSLLSMSFHDRYGIVFYAMTDRAAVRGRIEAVVVTARQKEALENDDDEEGPPPELRLVTAQREGFVLFRALAEQPGDHAGAENRLRSISCAADAG